jgi:hypothetical protein
MACGSKVDRHPDGRWSFRAAGLVAHAVVIAATFIVIALGTVYVIYMS